VHFHTLVPDGVFELPAEGRASFLPLTGPGPEELELLLRRIVRRVAKVLANAGEAADEGDALAALQAAEVDRRPRYPERFEEGRRSAYVDGFSLHAGVRIHANDRQGLERLCRYLARPPFALERLSELPDGRLAYRMKRPRGGSLWLVLTPGELIAKLATLVPPPGTHATRYHGLFAPNAKGRARVVPERAKGDAAGPAEAAPVKAEPLRALPAVRGSDSTGSGEGGPAPDVRYRIPWAELLKKVFAVDVLECPQCHGRLKVISYMTEGEATAEVLKHLGLDATGPPVAKAAAAPEPGSDSAPEYDGVDPVFDE
jgi:hypothetical protein